MNRNIRSRWVTFLLAVLISVGSPGMVFGGSKGTEQEIYSALVRVEPKLGLVLVAKDSGILWVEASQAAKPHVRELPVGAMIDMVVEMRGKDKPPLLKWWKLASGDSDCKHFNGKVCR